MALSGDTAFLSARGHNPRSWAGRLRFSAVLLVSGALLSGCATVKDAYTVDSVTKDPDSQLVDSNDLLLKGQYVPPAFNLYQAPYPGDVNPTGGTTAANNNKPATSTPASILCISGTGGVYKTTESEQCRSAYVYAISSWKEGRNALMGFLIRRS